MFRKKNILIHDVEIALGRIETAKSVLKNVLEKKFTLISSPSSSSESIFMSACYISKLTN